MPSSASASAAASAICTIFDQAMIVTSVPSRFTSATPSGIGVLAVGDLALVGVEHLALDEHDRVVVADRGLEQALGVVRRRRHHDLEAGDVRVERLERLAVLRADLCRRAARAAEHDRAA